MVCSPAIVLSYSYAAASGSSSKQTFANPARCAAARMRSSAWVFPVSPCVPWYITGRPSTTLPICEPPAFSALALMWPKHRGDDILEAREVFVLDVAAQEGLRRFHEHAAQRVGESTHPRGGAEDDGPVRTSE
jgi:hypothetical protein